MIDHDYILNYYNSLFTYRFIMIIALDFDHTFTTDPRLWLSFINTAYDNMHKVFIVTARQERDNHKWFERLKTNWVEDIIFCDGRAKREVMRELGFNVAIWIDDTPSNVDTSRPAGAEWSEYDAWRTWDLEAQSDELDLEDYEALL